MLSFLLLVVVSVLAPFVRDIVAMWEATPRRRYRYAWFSDGGSIYLRILRDSVSRPLALPSPAADLAIREKDLLDPAAGPWPAGARLPSIAKAA